MTSTAWRLMLLPLVLLAFLLVGAPDFPAFERAIRKAFAATTSDPRGSSPFAQAKDNEDPIPQLASPREPSPATDTRGGRPEPARSRGVLLPLYVSFTALQALDAHSTLRALDAGATEANPLMGGMARTPAAFVAVKAGLAASTIYLVEKIRVKHRGAAIVLMAALNSLYATVVAHNYRVVPRARDD